MSIQYPAYLFTFLHLLNYRFYRFLSIVHCLNRFTVQILTTRRQTFLYNYNTIIMLSTLSAEKINWASVDPVVNSYLYYFTPYVLYITQLVNHFKVVKWGYGSEQVLHTGKLFLLYHGAIRSLAIWSFHIKQCLDGENWSEDSLVRRSESSERREDRGKAT